MFKTTKQITYRNPVLPGFYPDPSAIRVGSDYYMVTSSFEYFPALPVFHSRDLIHWEQIGHGIDRRSQLDMSDRKSSAGIYAATIRYHEGTYYIITTDVMGIGNFYIHAEHPAGPWSDPIRIPYGNIDPSLMFDDDGKVYVTVQNGADAESHIIQYEIDILTGKALTEPVVVARGDGGVWTEGPHLYKIHGTYYLICACGGTARDHRELVYRSETPYGPFEMMPHPMLTHNKLPEHPIQNTGHAELVEDQEGNWWVLFLGVRPNAEGFSVLGRETFLVPVTWSEDGWPLVDNNEGGAELVMEVHLADTAVQETDSSSEGPVDVPASPGRTVWRDDFDRDPMSLRWTYLRTSPEESIRLKHEEGTLTLRGNAYTLQDDRTAVFAGVRQQQHRFSAETEMDFYPQRVGDEAGLAVLLNGRGHITLTVCRDGEQRLLKAAFTDQGMYEVVAELPLSGDGAVKLRAVSDGAVYFLEYRAGGSGEESMEWLQAASVPAEVVSPERNGGFTGAFLGLYATGNGADSESGADFLYFVCEEGSGE